MSTRNTLTCTHHCGACDHHFTSLNAFDAHRFSSLNGSRHCRPALYVDGLEVAASDGVCCLMGGLDPSVLRGVSLWGVVMSVKQRAGLARLRPDESATAAIQPEDAETVRVAA